MEIPGKGKARGWMCSAAIATFHPEAYGYFTEGVQRYGARDPAGAVASYRKAVELVPSYGPAWCNLGIALHSMGEHHVALECLEKALRLDDQDTEAIKAKALVLMKLCRLEEAVACLDHGMEVDPRDVDIAIKKGYALLSARDLSGAVRAFSRAIAIDPESAVAWGNRGVAYAERGKTSEALADYSKATALNPDYALAWGNKGGLLVRMGRLEEAQECLSRAVRLQPEDQDAYQELVICQQLLRERQPG